MAIEETVAATIVVRNVEFRLAGKLDRFDWVGPNALELVEYKTGKQVDLSAEREMELQTGLYALAVEQQWPGELQQVVQIYLGAGETLVGEVPGANAGDDRPSGFVHAGFLGDRASARLLHRHRPARVG